MFRVTTARPNLSVVSATCVSVSLLRVACSRVCSFHGHVKLYCRILIPDMISFVRDFTSSKVRELKTTDFLSGFVALLSFNSLFFRTGENALM